MLQERRWKNFYETYCTEETKVMPIYWYVVIVFVVWLPLVIMVLCYSALFFKASFTPCPKLHSIVYMVCVHIVIIRVAVGILRHRCVLAPSM
jgi:hypothetical protein